MLGSIMAKNKFFAAIFAKRIYSLSSKYYLGAPLGRI